jgi:hypothetical protein
VLGGTKVGEGSGDRFRSPAGPELLGFEYLGLGLGLDFPSTNLKRNFEILDNVIN